MTRVDATFRPSDGQQPWSGTLRQTVMTRMIDAGGELIAGTKTVVWDKPSPGVAYLLAASGVLEVGGMSCEAFWANGQFNHSDGFTE